MSQKRVSFKIGKVDFTLDFQDVQDLKSQLDEVESITQAISEKLGETIVSPSKVRDELQDVFTTDGKYLIFRQVAPKLRIDKTVLAVHGYGSATTEQIGFTVGVRNVSSVVLSQRGNSEYFIKNDDNDTWYLSDLGIDKVTEILRKLRDEMADREVAESTLISAAEKSGSVDK